MHEAMLTSNPVENVHASWHGMRGATHMKNVLNTQELFLSSTHTSIYLLHTIQPNSPLNLMLRFFHLNLMLSSFHLHYNVVQRGCRAISGETTKSSKIASDVGLF